jgi:hypothetical protein
MKKQFPPEHNFKDLSIQDLLDARDAYHVQLANMENVLATAIGLYRIRDKDPDSNTPLSKGQWATRAESTDRVRTLQNSRIQPWSWPCVLVFVSQWQAATSIDPDQVVPRYLYLGDGRIVPTCVIQVEFQQEAPPPLHDIIQFPHQLLGGGFPLVTQVQGNEHIGSVGCMVSDGSAVYALTNAHVIGEPQTSIHAIIDGQRQKVGTAHTRQLEKRPFQEIYPNLAGANSYLNLDAGLVRIDDIHDWTAQIYGLGELGSMLNLHTNTITLDLIGLPVCAFGAASGKMVGEIQGLFYRYKSIGGFDYVSDLLIGSASTTTPLKTMPGDSGSVWCYPEPSQGATTSSPSEQAPEPIKAVDAMRPLALQWGGHVVRNEDGQGTLNFALANFLSTICYLLDVDIVPDWNTSHREYWGEMGHYKIAGSACDKVQSANLNTLLQKNRDSIAYGDDDLENGTFRHNKQGQIVPLADVADLVWRNTRPDDESNHFSDVDQPGADGKTLLDLYHEHKLDIATWNTFYDGIHADEKRGALPFRVWQMYNEMIVCLQKSDVVGFVCTAGTMAHYVGDACQPLHASYLHHGHPNIPAESKVHSTYETSMLDSNAAELLAGVNKKLAEPTQPMPTIHGGKEAAQAVMDLMDRSLTALPPETIIDAFNKGRQQHKTIAVMWQALKDPTIARLVDGVYTLASIWDSAWQEGNGDQNLNQSQLDQIDYSTLKALYSQATFAPSYLLTDPKFTAELQNAPLAPTTATD